MSYDVHNETVITAGGDQVWRLLIDELAGARRWWTPDVEFDAPAVPDRPGARTQVTVHTRGARPGPALRFVAQTRDVVPGRQLTVDYVDGAFRGSATFSVMPGDGRARLTVRWQAEPHGWVWVLARVVNIGRAHQRTTAAALDRLSALVGDRTTMT